MTSGFPSYADKIPAQPTQIAAGGEYQSHVVEVRLVQAGFRVHTGEHVPKRDFSVAHSQ
jgi:hypothetical protein